MNKLKTEKEAKKPGAAAGQTKERAKDSAAANAPADGGWRETIESVAMAVILALLFRGFVAEAFVIPTGSMAPTLDGRHKDIKCPKCGTWYQVSCSEEMDNDVPSGKFVYSATCPVCRYSHWLDAAQHPNEGSFSGDRIIVGKFSYDFAEPKRWDVIVFKFPGNAVQNYIKRLIGLPGERVRIVGGNIYTSGVEESDDHLRIARKPPAKIESLLQIVDDTDHIPPELRELGWPSRWQAWPATSRQWQMAASGNRFEIDGKQPGEEWLRYRHLVPSFEDWSFIESQHRLPDGVAERPGNLIGDFYAYNTSRTVFGSPKRWWQSLTLPSYSPAKDLPHGSGPGDPPWPRFLGEHWVDDLAVDCTVDVRGSSGELSLLLVRAGVKHICRINLADGKATMSMVDPAGKELDFSSDDHQQTVTQPTATTGVRGPGRYQLRLSNVDHETLLWVNGAVVKFDGPTTYDPDGMNDMPVPRYTQADPLDMAPAGIGSRGAAVEVSSLKIYRDKYYIASDFDAGRDENDYSKQVVIYGQGANSEGEAIQAIFSTPELWNPDRSNLFAPENRRHVDFPLEEDQFFPLGDNSPQSEDARFWMMPMPDNTLVPHHYVERDLLIGKALLIYWPHTWNRPVPFWPNFGRMGRIR
jgi:signal peptidase I